MNWIKTHKLNLVLLAVIVYLLFRNNFLPIQPQPISPMYGTLQNQSMGISALTNQQNISQNRVMIQESNLSLVVSDVQKTGDKIVSYAKQAGGYMVDASYTRPSESPFATITVRVPTPKLNKAIAYFKSLGQKVTNENLVGTDVTTQYTNIAARLAMLESARTKIQNILNKAVTAQDTLDVTQQLISLQEQIDSYKGQQKSIDENAKLTKITVYLSTDELALPYTPDTTFRPAVVFKEAVRSLLNTVRLIAEAVIWVAAYIPLILIAIIIYIFSKRYMQKKGIR